MKICGKHNCEFKSLNYKVGGKIYTQTFCPLCRKEYKAQWYEQNRNQILNQKSSYYQDNKKDINEKHALYVESNKDVITEYKANWFQENKELINKNRRERYASDPSFRLRDIFSSSIRHFLKKSGNVKDGSILSYLGYTIEDLKLHLEKQFEPWMSWNNYGKYDSKVWKDNDPTTWTWNIDHIIPHSDLPYTSMEDDNFKKCWSLDNLRPFPAKENLIDGSTRKRHKGGK